MESVRPGGGRVCWEGHFVRTMLLALPFPKGEDCVVGTVPSDPACALDPQAGCPFLSAVSVLLTG